MECSYRSTFGAGTKSHVVQSAPRWDSAASPRDSEMLMIIRSWLWGALRPPPTPRPPIPPKDSYDMSPAAKTARSLQPELDLESCKRQNSGTTLQGALFYGPHFRKKARKSQTNMRFGDMICLLQKGCQATRPLSLRLQFPPNFVRGRMVSASRRRSAPGLLL